MPDTTAVSSEAIIEGIEAKETNSFVVSAPHIVQYPKPCDLKNGKWYAIPAIVGAALRASLNKADEGLEHQADDAERMWNILLGDSDTVPSNLLEDARDLFGLPNSETEGYDVEGLLKKSHDYALCGCTTDMMAVRLLSIGNKSIEEIKASVEKDIAATSRFNIGRVQQGYQRIEAAMMSDSISGSIINREATIPADWACAYDLQTTVLYSTENVLLNRKKAALEWFALYIEGLDGLMKVYSWLATTKRNAAVAKGAAKADLSVDAALAIIAGIGMVTELVDAKACANGTTTP